MHLTSINVSAAVDGASLALRIAADSPSLVRSVIVTSPIEPGGNRFAGSIPDSADLARPLDRTVLEGPSLQHRLSEVPRRHRCLSGRASTHRHRSSTFLGTPGTPNVEVRLDGDVLMTTLYQAMQLPVAMPLMPSTVATRNNEVVASFLVSIAQAMYTDPAFPWISYFQRWCADGGLGLDGVQITAEANSTPEFKGLAPRFPAGGREPAIGRASNRLRREEHFQPPVGFRHLSLRRASIRCRPLAVP